MAGARVLVIDDEPDMVSVLREWLEGDGHQVFSSTDGGEALRMFYRHRPDLCITDLTMPGMDGFQLISRIRDMSDCPVVIYTVLGTEDNLIRGLELGADEYLVKPVSTSVLLARVRSLLRRSSRPVEAPTMYSDDHLVLNFRTREVRVQDRQVRLRPTEFRLLALLVQNSHRVVPYQEILNEVWKGQGGSRDSLKSYVSFLREKIEGNPQQPRLIVNVVRVGYRYVPSDSRAVS